MCQFITKTGGNKTHKTTFLSSACLTKTMLQANWGQNLRSEKHILPTSTCEEKWPTYDTPTPGDLWCDHLYGLYTTSVFLPRPGNEKRRRKFHWQRAVGWISGSGSANCVFLLTFNSPKHPCFTAPWAIAFLNLSLERQELWSLSIEEKGMLFPCHPLVAPPSSLPWSTVQHPPYTFPLPHFAPS